MFEKSQDGVMSIDEDSVKVNKHGSTVFPLRIDDPAIGCPIKINVCRVYEPEGDDTFAKFIAYCFNLQRHYDISKLEEAVDILKSICSGSGIIDAKRRIELEQLLKQIKK